jgi:thiamine monophosphate kinase
MVNVVRQALQRRLLQQQGSTEEGFLTGAETSAVMIASDFLIQELESIAASSSFSAPKQMH